MKKIIGAALIVLSLAGCAGGNASGDSRTAEPSTASPRGGLLARRTCGIQRFGSVQLNSARAELSSAGGVYENSARAECSEDKNHDLSIRACSAMILHDGLGGAWVSC